MMVLLLFCKTPTKPEELRCIRVTITMALLCRAVERTLINYPAIAPDRSSMRMKASPHSLSLTIFFIGLLLLSLFVGSGRIVFATASPSAVQTLKQKLATLIADGVILSVPTMDYRKIDDAVPADLIVLFRPNYARLKVHREIMDLLEDYVIYAGAWDKFGLYSLIVRSVSDVSYLVEELDGVKMVRGEIVEEHVDQVGALGSYVEKWMAK
jgi:hypothetical protein